MATVYLDSAAAGGGTGADWTNAYTTLAAAFSGSSAGDTILMDDGHNESYTSSQTLTSPGTIDAPVTIIVVDKSDGSYSSNKGGTYNYRTISGSFDISLEGFVIAIGIYISSADDMSLIGADKSWIFEDSKIEIDVQVSSGGFAIGADGEDSCFSTHLNSIINLNTSGFIKLQGASKLYQNNVTIMSGSSGLTVYVNTTGSRGVLLECKNSDLSGVGGDYLIGPGYGVQAKFIRCKIPSGITAISGALTRYDDFVILEHCDTADDQNMFQHYYYYGSVVKATNCYRTASSVAFSAKMVSNTKAVEFTRPLRFKLCEFFAAVNPTLTVEYISEVTLQNDEFWVEVEYPDATDNALGKVDKSNKAADIMATPSNQTTSTEAWTEDLTEIKQKSAVTISGGAAGIHTVWVCLAKPSTTVYVDPQVTVS